jgi:hypothetical protein
MDMTTAERLTSEPMRAARETSFVETICLPLLVDSQNTDGGWGFHSGSQSTVEATCWALQALLHSGQEKAQGSVASGLQFLRAAQLADGSWPASLEQKAGCWVTSLACWVLIKEGNSEGAVASGLSWLCEDWPADSSPWRRFLGRFTSQQRISPINTSYRGWGWTPQTSSWVEPTSIALLALSQSPEKLLPPAAKRRRQLAEALLYDRMCPGGAWNCGNPMVYGVAGDRLVVSTVWALLALRHYPERSENVISLNWLEENVAGIQGPGSLALARICLDTYGRKWPLGETAFQDLHKRNEFLHSIQVVAWTCLALGPKDSWLAAPSREIA